uniref:Uncharacterized protein n=1 Tax=Utricularia reniformis TaxID=192314 RepID=A0A1Y0B290_9LAMI|nr:hypothetical protein AEK19_MT1301 [Utricularia reniformis]ART31504.1 hypothetical protein AEK19_MT1301 [Utricularia reniformis]
MHTVLLLAYHRTQSVPIEASLDCLFALFSPYSRLQEFRELRRKRLRDLITLEIRVSILDIAQQGGSRLNKEDRFSTETTSMDEVLACLPLL